MTVTMSTSAQRLVQQHPQSPRQSMRDRGCLPSNLARVGNANDFESLGKSTQCRNMGSRGPTPARLQANDANLDAMSCHNVLFSFCADSVLPLKDMQTRSVRKFGE